MKRLEAHKIIKGCQQEDPTYQKALVMQYSSLLMAVSMRYSRDKDSAKDVLQEALIKIIKNIGNYKELGSFEGWMKRIVINTALKSMDKKSIKNELYVLDKTQEKTQTPEVYDHLAVEEILNVIDQLPLPYRTIFNLYAIEGYDHKEIADILGIKESSSRSRLTRARKILREILSNNDKIGIRI